MDYRSKDDGGGSSEADTAYTKLSAIRYLKSSDIDIRAELASDRENENVISITPDKDTQSTLKEYMYYKFTKRGSTSDDEADSSGTNAAVLASEAITLRLRDSLIFTSGDHAHGVFSLGEDTSVVVSECVVSAMGANSSCVMTYDGGRASLYHVTAETFGTSSPALRVCKGGGSINAERGRLSTSGINSPVILAEGTVSVSNAKLEAEESHVAVIEGRSSVSLTSCDVASESSSVPAVMMYMEESGNPVTNAGSFTMSRGKITCGNGDMFYVSNSAANIILDNVDIDCGGAILRAEASKWGASGLNGGQVTLMTIGQTIEGNIYLDGVSDMNMYLTEGSYFVGAVNPSGTDARIYADISSSKWVLTEDSHIDSLTCEENSITLNGHTLYVGGIAYTAGTSSSGTEIDFALDRNLPSTQDEAASGDDENTGTDDGTTEDTDDEDTRTPEISVDTDTEDSRLSFDAILYTTGTVNGTAYRAYSDISYVRVPADEDYQKLSIYIPEPYFSSRPVNGYTAQTAPIFIPNNSSGYMAATIMTPEDSNIVGLALSRGLIVVSPALRGRNITGGTAPASIVDYKAAIRYIRANKSRIPAGNTDRIIACGVSSGGALSALLGASGNTADYDTWLEELEAADAEDNIFAAASYCPVTNLENADSAYEWIFGGEKYGEDSVNLAEDFESYINTLGLVNDSKDLEIYEDDDEYEDGFTFRRYIEGLYVQAAQKAMASGSVISADWITMSSGKPVSADLTKYADSFTTRQKGIPAFDKFDLSSPENSMFGYKHFTDYSHAHSVSGGEIADSETIWIMNPMNYIENADTCKYWRIRHGVNDRDITLTIPTVLALALRNSGFTVDFSAVWGQGHGGYYDTDELFTWIDSICK